MNFNGFISYSHAADGRLAPAVQRGLHRLAKPWHRRRALWIFRDQTGLSVTPTLWSSIQHALDGSEWFVLLASPEAAQSPWVNREIEHWIATKPADRILPVVTDGEWRWDPEIGDLAAESTAVPDALRGVFAEEPLYLDLRWARDDRQLSLQHARFRDAIAQLAAPMHGVSKDELEGEDVRQHRRGMRLRWVAVAALAVLTLVASLAGVVAGRNADRATASAVEAQRQKRVAVQQQSNAERSAQRALQQEENAKTQEGRAKDAAAETKRQETRAREQQAAAKRAAAEAARQQKNAARQQQLAEKSRALAEQQRAVAGEQSKLAEEAADATTRARKIAEMLQDVAAEATKDADKQKANAKQAQRLADEAKAEAVRQGVIAAENEEKAKAAAAEAAEQEANAAEQKQIALGRRLLNQAKATIDSDPATALKLGLAAQKIQPGTEARDELAGLVTSTRQIGAVSDVVSMAYGPNNIVAVTSADYTASLWSVANPARPVRLSFLDGPAFLRQPAFSPDGKTLAIVGQDNWNPVLFDVSDPVHPVQICMIFAPDAGWLTFSPDGKTLVVVELAGRWTLWDLTDRKCPAQLTTNHPGSEQPMTFGADGHTVVTGGDPGFVWDITDRTNPIVVGVLEGKWWGATVNPTRPLVVTNDQAENLVLWDVSDRTKPQKLSTVAGRVSYQYNAVGFSPDGLTLATSDSSGTVRIWGVIDKALVPLADLDSHGGSAETLAFSPDGRILATATANGTLSLWTVPFPGEPKIVGRATAVSRSMEAATISADGQRLTTAQSDGTATVWDLSEPADPVARATMRVRDSSGAAAFAPRGDLIAARTAYASGPVTLADISDPSAPVSLAELSDRPYAGGMAFSPDGNTVALAYQTENNPDRSRGAVELWDLTNRQHPTLLPKLLGNSSVNSLATALAFSPDGHTVAVGAGKVVMLWNLADRSNPVQVGTLTGHSDTVLAVAFSPDGRTLATTSRDRTAALWNVADPKRLRRQAVLTGNDAAVTAVAFSPDGRTLGTSTGPVNNSYTCNGTTLWNLSETSGPIRIATLKRAGQCSSFLLFHPDGHTLTNNSGYGTVGAAVWDYTALNELRADPAPRACAITGGGWTADEWATYIPEVPYQETCPG